MLEFKLKSMQYGKQNDNRLADREKDTITGKSNFFFVDWRFV